MSEFNLNEKTKQDVLNFLYNWYQSLTFDEDSIESFRIRLEKHIENLTKRSCRVKIPILDDEIKYKVAKKTKMIPKILVKYKQKVILTINKFGPLR